MAVQLADREGIEGLSIRKLAERLDAAPMALYRHVANKEDLVDGMVDVVYGEVETPSGIGWKAATRQRAISMRATLLAHPWAVGVLEARSPGPAKSRSTAAVTGRRVYVDRASKEGHVCAALWFVAADAVHPAGRRGPDFSAAGRRSSHSGARRAYTYSSTHSPFHHALCRWCASRRIRR